MPGSKVVHGVSGKGSPGRTLLVLFVYLPVAGSVMNLAPFSKFHWLFEVNLSLSIYYLAFHLAGLLLFLIFFRVFHTVFSVFTMAVVISMAVLTGRPLLPFYRTKALPDESGKERLSLFYANFDGVKVVPEKAGQLIRVFKPEAAVLVNVDRTLVSGMKLKSVYPYSVTAYGKNGRGAAFYSSGPFKHDLISFKDDVGPALKIVLKNGPVIFVFSAPAAFSREGLYYRKIVLKRVASAARHLEGAVIAVGDFNASIYSAGYKQFTGDSGFRDVMYGRGLFASWISRGFPLVRFTPDHILYRGKLKVTRLDSFSIPEASHISFLVSFSETLDAG